MKEKNKCMELEILIRNLNFSESIEKELINHLIPVKKSPGTRSSGNLQESAATITTTEPAAEKTQSEDRFEAETAETSMTKPGRRSMTGIEPERTEPDKTDCFARKRQVPRQTSGTAEGIETKESRQLNELIFLQSLAAHAYEGEGFAYPLLKEDARTRLFVVVLLLMEKYVEYRKLGVPDSIIFDTFRDVARRAGTYYHKHDATGLSEDDVIWLRHIMQVNLFHVGVLQFQVFRMIFLDEETIGKKYMEYVPGSKAMLGNGDPVINIHIPKGTDLDREKVLTSFRLAAEFFAAVFPRIHFKAFLCYSWLLYPPMTGQLPAESRIKDFAACFDVIGFCDDSDQARANIDNNRNTVLSRLEVRDLGYACGIILLENLSMEGMYSNRYSGD